MRRCDAAFKKEILLKCYDALESEGFTRYRKEDVDWPLHDGFHCWVGLNTGLHPDRVNVNPFVGIHAVPIMRLYTKLEGRTYSRSVATYAVHMGELAGAREERATALTPEQSDGFVTSETRRLARLYATVGLDYARSIASYEALLPLLQGRLDMLGGYPERVASCLYLMGRKAEAKAFAEEFLAKQREYFEAFAVPFLRMLANGDASEPLSRQAGR